MMGKILVLDEHIANQIAAGEVVERPASIVKELVENAIDAGSNKIDIAIEDGGLKSISVKDNGSGIAPDDCLIAFERHATSKIATGNDLFQIRSLGFRGEALPSIAAVSKLECISSAQSDGLGRRVVIEGGSLILNEDTAASQGTHIRVTDLFYNTPARLKYMKTIQTELTHISNYIYRLSLAHPAISFTFSHQGKVLLQTLGKGDLLQVIAAIYGAAIARQMIPAEGESLDYKLTGFIGKPEATRANRFGMSVIINGRYIQNFALAKAIMNAYHTLLPINRYPMAVLDIEMAPSLLDVNVHPSKLEVRFSKEQELLQFIEETIKETLQQHVHIPRGTIKQPSAQVHEQLQWSPPPVERSSQQQATDRYQPPKQGDMKAATSKQAELEMSSARELASTQPGDRNDKLEAQQWNRTQQPGDRDEKLEAQQSRQTFTQQQRRSSYNGSQQQGSGRLERMPEEVNEAMSQFLTAPQASEQRKHTFPELHPIGQMHGTYIIAQNEDGLYLIDQHAAHERIFYEIFYNKFGSDLQYSQDLLVPITLEFTPSESAIIQSHLALFEQVGVKLSLFGKHSFIVRSYPHWFVQGEEKAMIEEMVEWVIAEGKGIDVAKMREQFAITCACKAAIKANQHLSMAEIEALLHQLAQCKNPYTCPHGRPIMISYSNYELAKMFKRT